MVYSSLSAYIFYCSLGKVAKIWWIFLATVGSSSMCPAVARNDRKVNHVHRPRNRKHGQYSQFWKIRSLTFEGHGLQLFVMKVTILLIQHVLLQKMVTFLLLVRTLHDFLVAGDTFLQTSMRSLEEMPAVFFATINECVSLVNQSFLGCTGPCARGNQNATFLKLCENPVLLQGL